MSTRRVALLSAVALLCTLTTACERLTHDMGDQPRSGPASRSDLFADGLADRPLVPHARASILPPLPAAARAGAVGQGRERYGIYCQPCHGAAGAGDGPVVQRGFPAPPRLSQPLLDALDDTRMVALIRDGGGVMPGFADRIDAREAQAIVAYVRRLPGATR